MSGESYRYRLGACAIVTEELNGVHPIHTDYPLLPGDVLTKSKDGTWAKHTGLGIFGFTLSPEQEATLQPRAGATLGVGSMGWFLSQDGAAVGGDQ